MKKIIPKLKNEDQEKDFWVKHDSAEYIDWKGAKKVIMPNLKLSTKTVSIRLPEVMIDDLKFLANKKDVPYQSLLKIFLSEKIRYELQVG